MDPSEQQQQQRTESDTKNGVTGEQHKDTKGGAHIKEEATDDAAKITAKELAEKEKTLATLRENQVILSKKLYQERGLGADLRKEVERYRAMETAVRCWSMWLLCGCAPSGLTRLIVVACMRSGRRMRRP